MDNKKFLSSMAVGLAVVMFFSIFYIIFINSKKEVENYKLDEGLYYTGFIERNKFEGKGNLESTDGIYIGNFENGRFKGPGLFKGKDYTYMANFNKNKGNSNIHINLNNGNSYTKTDGKWQEMSDSNED